MTTTSEALAIAIRHHQAGRLQAAEQIYRQILAVEPQHADALHLLGLLAAKAGRHEAAVAYIEQAIRLNGNDAFYHNNLGEVHRALHRIPEAMACYRRAVELKPDLASAHNNLGNAFRELGHSDEALACYRRALELKPDLAEAHNNLGVVLKNQGRLDEALASYRRALELKPDFAGAHSNLLLALQFCPGVTPAGLAEAHADFERRRAAPLRDALPPWEGVHARAGKGDSPIFAQAKIGTVPGRLRLGFVSRDLGRHPVGYFLVRTLENLDKEQFDTVCYYDGTVKDTMTRRLQTATTEWHDVFGTNDQQLAQRIRADRIDILFDLAGHTAHNRLLVFARKPAPVQVTWAGYAGTTGLASMDYLLADRYEIPPGAERYYREQVLRMPDGYVCYDPPAYAPPVAPLPALRSGEATFGCFNNPAKITPRVVETWARILRRRPGSRLVLKFNGWNDSGMVRRFTELFAAHEIDLGRLELLGPSPHAKLLAEYNRIDLALDPFPYSGGLTTCEALWMGVPVVTCPGETFASRHSFSHLSNVGLTETIARDLDDYVQRAVCLAGDLPRLAALRAGLRQQMAGSGLCDGKRFATNLALLLREVWQRPIGR